jgi:hypothetical protein
MATPSNAALRKKTPFFISVFVIHDTRCLLADHGYLLGDRAPSQSIAGHYPVVASRVPMTDSQKMTYYQYDVIAWRSALRTMNEGFKAICKSGAHRPQMS